MMPHRQDAGVKRILEEWEPEDFTHMIDHNEPLVFEDEIEDPDEERMQARREEAKKVQSVGERPFKPSAINSSRPARTIVFHQAGVKM